LSKIEDMMKSGTSISSILETNDVCIALRRAEQFKRIAFLNIEQGKWEDSHNILENIYNCDKKMHFCRMKSCSLHSLADTLLHLRIVRQKLGYSNLASKAFHESLALHPQKLMENDVGVALAINRIALIQRQAFCHSV